MKKIDVVAALIEKNDKYLIAQRATGDLKDKWEFPGGKVEKNETESEAIVREIYEEFSVSVKCDYYVCSDSNDKFDIKLYHCTYLSGEMKLNSHSSYVFVDKSLLLSYDLAPIDKNLAKKIVNN